MNWKKWNIGYRGFISMVIALSFVLMWQGCSKEELSVRDVSFEELKNSFYVLAETTIELGREDYDNLIIQKTVDELLVKNQGVFENINIGSHILSSPSLPREDLIWRKITGIQISGENLILQTENANILEAFTEFYFDSDLPLISAPRESETLDDVPPEEVNQMFSNVGQEPTFQLSPIFDVSGSPKFKAIHPHTAYRVFGPCKGSQACFDGKSFVDIKGKGGQNPNGIIDVVDDYFGNKLDEDINKNGFYVLTIEGLGINQIGATYGTSTGTGGAVELDVKDTPEQINTKISNATVQTASKVNGDALNIKYVLTPITVWGLSLTIPISPILTFDYNASMSMTLNMTFPNKLNVELGHINVFNGVGNIDIKPSISIKDGIQPASFTKMFESPSVNFYAGINGIARTDIGIGIGAAVSIGEPISAGISVGGMFEFTNFYILDAEAGVNVPNILSDNPLANANVFGRICFDTGIDYNISIFSDSNLGPFGGNFFDKKYTLPKESAGFGKFSVLKFIESYASDKGICAEYNSLCGNITQPFFEIGIKEDRTIFRFKHNAPEGISVPYSVTLDLNESDLINSIIGTTKIKLDGDFTFNSQHISENTTMNNEVQASIFSGRLKIVIKPQDANCSADFSIGESSVAFDCGNTDYTELWEYSEETSGIFVRFPDLSTNNFYYYDSLSCADLCAMKGGFTLPSSLEIRLYAVSCINPTGYVLVDGNQGSKYNGDKLYARIPDQEGGMNTIEVELKIENGRNVIKKINTINSSESTLLPCACNLN